MLKLIFCAFVSCMRPGQNLLKAKLRPVRPAPACGAVRSRAKLELFARRLPRSRPPVAAAACGAGVPAVSGACRQQRPQSRAVRPRGAALHVRHRRPRLEPSPHG